MFIFIVAYFPPQKKVHIVGKYINKSLTHGFHLNSSRLFSWFILPTSSVGLLERLLFTVKNDFQAL